eukprot:5107528-Prorocentrum_lima.AAC.1
MCGGVPVPIAGGVVWGGNLELPVVWPHVACTARWRLRRVRSRRCAVRPPVECRVCVRWYCGVVAAGLGAAAV